MGWFDKKSWQLRRKIRDLQAELSQAERDGKYVVEQGLFFAELQEMGDATLMVLGTANHLDAEEETVIRTFFGRNGFTVENLKLDKTHKTLAAVEIIPPEELTRRVARALKENGYRLVDDSDKEKPSDLEANTLTLSGIIRSISALFSMHVYQLIISTHIKNNMEGNRLLHWMPLIRNCLLTKVSQDVVNLCREPFVSAYNHYYGQLGQMKEPEALQVFSEDTDDTEPADNPLAADDFLTPKAGSPTPPSVPVPARTFSSSGSKPIAGISQDDASPAAHHETDNAEIHREIQAAHSLARIYKSLIRASNQESRLNAEGVLEIIREFFSADSANLIVRSTPEAPFTAQASSTAANADNVDSENELCQDTALLTAALATSSVTVIGNTDNPDKTPKAIIAPLALDSGTSALVYIQNPLKYASQSAGAEAAHIAVLTEVFTEFPDLLMNAPLSKKN